MLDELRSTLTMIRVLVMGAYIGIISNFSIDYFPVMTEL